MAINSVGENLAIAGQVNTVEETENKNILGKDDFMKLLLVQLQHQDPTEPVDSETILTQTSQLATLEASANTNKALSDLAESLANSQQFTAIAAIGKTADLGSDAIAHDEGSTSSFEIYFPNDVNSGTIEISDGSGNVIQTINVGTNPKGVYQFDWDGTSQSGNLAGSGIYNVNASYSDSNGDTQTTRLGAYPIESIRFDGGQTLVKLGSNYVPLANVKEVY